MTPLHTGDPGKQRTPDFIRVAQLCGNISTSFDESSGISISFIPIQLCKQTCSRPGKDNYTDMTIHEELQFTPYPL